MSVWNGELFKVAAVQAFKPVAMRKAGTCKRWIDDRGFGFVKKDDGGQLFVHVKELQRSGIESLTNGDRITFEEQQTRSSGKPCAVNIEKEMI